MTKEEKIIGDLLEYISSLEPEDKSNFAHNIIFEVVNWSSFNYFEAIGILESVKINYHETWSDVIGEENTDRKNIN